MGVMPPGDVFDLLTGYRRVHVVPGTGRCGRDSSNQDASLRLIPIYCETHQQWTRQSIAGDATARDRRHSCGGGVAPGYRFARIQSYLRDTGAVCAVASDQSLCKTVGDLPAPCLVRRPYVRRPAESRARPTFGSLAGRRNRESGYCCPTARRAGSGHGRFDRPRSKGDPVVHTQHAGSFCSKMDSISGPGCPKSVITVHKE